MKKLSLMLSLLVISLFLFSCTSEPCPETEDYKNELRVVADNFYAQVEMVQDLYNSGDIYTEKITDPSFGKGTIYSRVMFKSSSARDTFMELVSYFYESESLLYFDDNIEGSMIYKNITGRYFNDPIDIAIASLSDEDQKNKMIEFMNDPQTVSELKLSSIFGQVHASMNYLEKYGDSYIPKIDPLFDDLEIISLPGFSEELNQYTDSICKAMHIDVKGGWTSGIWIRDNEEWKLFVGTAG
ncbi:hypothetical protein HN695_00670 [Candidatus Woesearchaeota archaeon]|jgi:hypothetical protein|nr:hypothetical protein [Candidatus Woesearchaeota archaeon]MBT5272814.1 hypothetical protein [Candidatus Woesearchaeota archaeon]MBT6040426.1 hypothetical protein [Candidatus Woesearchaeota archaeon]MBT6336941.1 hypothetical protein [Candidatus Woesearchaeota archaeon]MBT7926827.1 hypothetical protein [Candidatus Woesearchaeota archaeon]